MSRTFRFTLVLIVISFLSGCITARMQQSIFNTHVSLEAVAISEDGRRIAALTDRYDFVFENAHELNNVLKGQLHPYVRAEFSTFTVKPDSSVTGALILYSDALPRGLAPEAEHAGFKKNVVKNTYSKLYSLTGTAYRVTDVARPATLRLNNKYRVTVKLPETSDRRSLKLLLTPFTLIADVASLAIPFPGWIIIDEMAPGL